MNDVSQNDHSAITQKLRLCFVVALVFLVISVSVVFSSQWGTITGVIGAVYALLNYLLSSQKLSNENELASKFKYSLGSPRLLTMQIILVILAVGGIWGWKYFEYRKKLEDAPFRVVYRTYEGLAVDFLVKGSLDNKIDKILTSTPIILQNQTYLDLRALAGRFSEKFDSEDYFEIEVDGEADTEKAIPSRQKELDKLFKLNSSKKFFVGSRPPFWGFEKDLSEEGINSIVNQGPGWRAGFFTEGYESGYQYTDVAMMNALFFWRFAGKGDVKSFYAMKAYHKWLDFYSYVTESYFPPDFCIVEAYPIKEGCGDRKEYVSAHLNPPLLRVRVAIIENITSLPIRIKEFDVKENSIDKLRKYNEEVASLKKLSPKGKSWFNAGILKPSEQIIVPLEIVFSLEPNYGWHYPTMMKMQDKAKEVIKTVSQEASPIGAFLPISRDGLLQILDRSQVDISKLDEYVYATASSIESIEANDDKYPVRSRDISNLAVWGKADIGSCPFLFTRLDSQSGWQSEGHILYAQNKKEKESVDQKVLSRFDGSLLIRENDPETSFIDFVRVKALLADGGEQIFYPLNDRLSRSDGQYLKLNQGEEVELRFVIPESLQVSRYIVIVKGYYVPYGLNQNGRNY